MSFWIYVAAYFIVAVPWCMWRERGWLIMVTDTRNVGKATFLATPGIFLMWLFWPICNIVTYSWFVFAIYVGRRIHEREKGGL